MRHFIIKLKNISPLHIKHLVYEYFFSVPQLLKLKGRILELQLCSGSTWGSVMNRQFAALQPWSDFVRPSRFSIPRNPKVIISRLLKNSEKFFSNYLCVSFVLFIYCMYAPLDKFFQFYNFLIPTN